jgi:hypothetical protein
VAGEAIYLKLIEFSEESHARAPAPGSNEQEPTLLGSFLKLTAVVGTEFSNKLHVLKLSAKLTH